MDNLEESGILEKFYKEIVEDVKRCYREEQRTMMEEDSSSDEMEDSMTQEEEDLIVQEIVFEILKNSSERWIEREEEEDLMELLENGMKKHVDLLVEFEEWKENVIPKLDLALEKMKELEESELNEM